MRPDEQMEQSWSARLLGTMSGVQSSGFLSALQKLVKLLASVSATHWLEFLWEMLTD